MIARDPRTGLLRAHSRVELQDVAEPNLLREIFPYNEVPRVVFDGQSVPMAPPADYFLTDTTFRDGQQARPPYKVEQIVKIYDMLSRLGGPNGVVRVSEFFLYTNKDKEAVQKCQELGHKYPEVTGWIRATKSDFALVKEMGLRETGILTSCSDYHIFLKLKKTRKEMHHQYCDLVTTALESGLDAVRCHLEDVTRADFYGFVVPLVQDLMEIAHQAKKPVKIRLCDTMGYGLPYAEATLPRSIPKMIHSLVTECGVPNAWLEWHGHNDFHKVLVNSTTAWLYGCAAANCALLGFGERTGNPPLEGAIIDYISLRGETNGIDTRIISEIGEYFAKELDVCIPHNYPFVGDNFNVTSAGIHADGMLKNEEIYNIFDTAKILNRPVRVNVTDKSGLAGVAHWVNSYLGLKPEAQIDKRHPGVAAINDWSQQQYDAGRITSISDAEMLAQSRLHLPEYFKSDFDKIRERAQGLSERLIEHLLERTAFASMEADKIEQVLEEEIQIHPVAQFLYVTDVSGRRITRNITLREDKDEYSSLPVGEDLSDREWFNGAQEIDDVYITDFYKSRFTGRLCLTAAAPIKDADGNTIGVLGADLKFAELARMTEAMID
jgi:isopropylmalate/homocitrate/citramalate synthase